MFVGILLFSLLLFQGSKYFAQNVLKNQLYHYVEITQREISSSMGLMMGEISLSTLQLLSNSDIYDVFGNDGMSYEEKSKNFRSIIGKLKVQGDIIGDIAVVSNNGQTFFLNSDETEPDREMKTCISKIKLPPQYIWGPVYRKTDGEPHILLGRMFRNYYTGQDIGYLVIFIREKVICDIYEKMISEWGYSFILDNNNRVISHPDKEKVGDVILDAFQFNENKDTTRFTNTDFNGNKTILATYSLDQNLLRLGIKWKIVSVISENKLFSIIHSVDKYAAVLEIFVLLLAFILTYYLSERITRPIALLRKKVNLFGKGNLKVAFIESKGDEIRDLEESFNEMVIRIKDLVHKNNEEKEKQRELELIALQAQINPHFIYNTLDAISWIARMKKPEETERLILALATFFRISLHKGDKYITVDEETDLIRSFVTVEQMRFPGKFDIEYDIADDIKDIQILKIVLQPIVENAIKHGIGKKKGKGHIDVIGRMNGDELVFEVIDDGIGFNTESVDLDEKTNSFKKSGYGIRNVDERIKLEYGKEYGMTFKSQIGIGTIVRIRMKVR